MLSTFDNTLLQRFASLKKQKNKKQAVQEIK